MSKPWAVATALAACAVLLAACSPSEEEEAADPAGDIAPADEAAEQATDAPDLEPMSDEMPISGVSSDQTPVTFTDVARTAGLDHQQQVAAVPPDCLFSDQNPGVIGCTSEWMSGGIAVGDYDGDGADDLYFTRLHDGGLLYRNLGDGRFADATTEAGLDIPINANGAGFADLDADGDLDLVVTTIAEPRFYLFVNGGDGTFTEEAVERGVALESEELRGGQSVAFGDYDNDGWTDIHLTEWIEPTLQSPGPSQHARLLHNRGSNQPGFFEDVTEEAGVVLGVGRRDSLGTSENGNVPVYSFASAFADLDGDGWSDLVVAGDYGTSQLFWNDGDGTFTEGTDEARFGTEGNAMGLAIGDIDGDGLLDVFITAIFGRATDCQGRPCDPRFTGNRLYLNNGDRTFTEGEGPAGLTDGAWGWGTALLDIDNDGLLDVVMANGVDLGLTPEEKAFFAPFTATPPRVWLNQGDGTFADVAEAAGVTATQPTTGLAVMDLADDGALDVLMVQNRGEPLLYRNSGSDDGWLRVRVEPTDSNPDALGAVVEVVPAEGEAPIVRHIGVGTHFLGQSEHVAHIGLGEGERPVAEVRVRFPATGREVVQTDVARNETITVAEPES